MSARSVQTGHSVVDQNATTDRPLFQREGKTSSNVVQSTDCPLEMRRSAVEWPPNSPDLSPCDYWMFNQAKRKSQRFASIGEAKVEFERKLDEIPLEQVRKAIDNFPVALLACLAAQGDHFKLH